MFCTSQNLILLAKSSESPTNHAKSTTPKSGKQTKKRNTIDQTVAANWTLYNLKIAQTDVLYKDFMDLANEHKTDSIELITGQNSDKVKIYALLLSEAHIILRIAKEICFDGQIDGVASISHGKQIENASFDRIQKLYFDSCQQLADFYVM